MTVHRFVSEETDPFARGQRLGRVARDQILANIEGYARLFHAVGVTRDDARGYGAESVSRIQEWAPALAAEARGLADGANVPLEWIGALNARTEILAIVGETGEGECSTVVCLPEDGAPRTIQTWDWHDEPDSDTLVVRHLSASGLTVRYFSEFGVLGKIGLNSAGIGVHFNILNHSADGGCVGVPVHVVARRILDTATTLADAVEIARSATVTASTVLTVLAFDGARATGSCIELNPLGAAVIPPSPDRVLVHTNHFLDQTLAEGELSPAGSTTFPRYRKLWERRGMFDTADPLERAAALAVHQEDGAAVCCHPNPDLPFHLRWESRLTISLDLLRGRLQFFDGRPCMVDRAGWQTF